MKMEELLRAAVEKQAADIFLIPGMPLSYRIGGKIVNHNEEKIFPQEMDKLIEEFYGMAGNRDMCWLLVRQEVEKVRRWLALLMRLIVAGMLM